MELLLSIIELLQFINFPHPVAVLEVLPDGRLY